MLVSAVDETSPAGFWAHYNSIVLYLLTHICPLRFIVSEDFRGSWNVVVVVVVVVVVEVVQINVA